MAGYFIFLFALLVLMALAEITRRLGFSNLIIRRSVENNAINQGEDFKITIVIENNKRLPVSFLHLSEKMPVELECREEDSFLNTVELNYHNTRYNINWFERIKRTYTVNAPKRGTYLLREMKVSIGDPFGFYTSDKDMEDYLELLVYPKLSDINKIQFNTTSIYGNSIIKRWIYKDPLYIKGIREYNVEDRMKDIHWKSSLKMNKLMVKDYDYTSEMEAQIILNVECGSPYWSSIDPKAVERGTALCGALALQCIKEGIPAGMWTNSQIVYFGNDYKREVSPSIKSMKGIMELCARIDYTPRVSFYDYLLEKSKDFNKNTTYIIVASFLSEESIGMLLRLRRMGFFIKLIDVSSKSNIPYIAGIDKAVYREEMS